MSKVFQKRILIYAIFDRILDEIPARIAIYTPYIYMVLANPKYEL
jgi:hypothetical protein